MTKQERELVDQIRLQIQGLQEQYTYLLEINATMVDEIRDLRTENERLKKGVAAANGHCYFGGDLLPFRWRG